MLVFTFGILHFGLCWEMIDPMAEVVVFIKKALSLLTIVGWSFTCDNSLHPEWVCNVNWLGYRQVVRHSTLTAVCAGSNPASPARFLIFRKPPSPSSLKWLNKGVSTAPDGFGTQSNGCCAVFPLKTITANQLTVAEILWGKAKSDTL